MTVQLDLTYSCRDCGMTATAPAGTDPLDLKTIGRYCDDCGGNEDDAA